MAVALLGASGMACAADQGLYVFGGIGQMSSGSDQSDLDATLASAGASGYSSSISNATILSVELGYRINSYFAIEGGYVGSISDETYSASLPGASFNVNVSSSGAKLVGVGLLALGPQIDVFAKVGAADMHTSASVSASNGFTSASGSDSGTKTDLTYGVGAAWNASPQLAVRLDVDSYTLALSGGTSKRAAYTLGVQYRF
jgi:opacity protein-like surface antigen